MPEQYFQYFSCRPDNGILVVTFTVPHLQGDEQAEQLRKDFITALEHYHATKLVLDFCKVEFLTSSAFRPLLSLHRKLQERKGRMIFCNLSDTLLEVFVVTRLISTTRTMKAPFEMAKDLTEALARLRHHLSRIEAGVLILTLTDSKLHGDELADSLGEELLAAVNAAKATKVILDFARVEAITTPCMRPLLMLRKHMREHEGRVLLCNLQPLVAEVLAVTHLIAGGGSGPVPLETAADIPAALAVLQS